MAINNIFHVCTYYVSVFWAFLFCRNDIIWICFSIAILLLLFWVQVLELIIFWTFLLVEENIFFEFSKVLHMMLCFFLFYKVRLILFLSSPVLKYVSYFNALCTFSSSLYVGGRPYTKLLENDEFCAGLADH